jgi:hypothetical protein
VQTIVVSSNHLLTEEECGTLLPTAGDSVVF